MSSVGCWDLFCRVVDNYGDAGVCWRLARQLASEHHLNVRLWIDDIAPLAAMAPDVNPSAVSQRASGVEVVLWENPFPETDVADVVIEAFACELPASYLGAMANRATPPVWINLEYLSAEEWVEGCHLGQSPQSGTGLSKTFFFPGFTERTGGLLRERELPFNRSQEWEASFPMPEPPTGDSLIPGDLARDELLVSLFCYDNPRLVEWLDVWASGSQPLRLVVPPGPAMTSISRWLDEPLYPGDHISERSLSIEAIQFLSQQDYDKLLAWCDVNFVRGEDSFVRAQWACRPFLWQAYPQAESAHFAKVDAFLSRFLGSAPDELARTVGRASRFWNGFADSGDPEQVWSAFRSSGREIARWGKVWADRLDRAGDLANNLVRFANERRS